MAKPPTSRFWGLIIQPGKCYKQTVQNDFHMSMATLDSTNAAKDCHVQVKVEVNGSSYIICQLKSDQILQHPLDLMFDTGDEISCMVEGTSPQPVHLTGYYTEPTDGDWVPVDDEQSEEEMDEEEELLEDEDDKECKDDSDIVAALQQKKVAKNEKNKAGKNAKNSIEVKQQPQVKAGKRKKLNGENGMPAKMTKLSDSLTLESSDPDDDAEISDLKNEDEEAEDEEIEDGFSDDDGDMEADDVSGGDEDGEEVEDEEEDDDGEEEEDDDDEESFTKELSPSFSSKANKKSQVKVEDHKVKANNKKRPEKLTKAEKQIAKENQPPSAKKSNGAVKVSKRMIGGGVMIEDLTVGAGTEAKNGRAVTVYYKGVLQQNNKQFDATTSGPGFKFRLGAGEVIKGWDRGVEGMRVGGKRRITCPPGMAYGKKGCHPVIPGNSTLVFEVTLKNVH